MAQTMAEALIEEGIEKGRVQAKREDLLRMMGAKFGDVPQSVAERVRGMSDIEALELMMIRLLHVDSIEAMGL